jgi:hypothetical protein
MLEFFLQSREIAAALAVFAKKSRQVDQQLSRAVCIVADDSDDGVESI